MYTPVSTSRPAGHGAPKPNDLLPYHASATMERKAAIRSAGRKFRKANDGMRLSVDFTGPCIESDFEGWLAATKQYWRKLNQE